jgi:hypothetical protein
VNPYRILPLPPLLAARNAFPRAAAPSGGGTAMQLQLQQHLGMSLAQRLMAALPLLPMPGAAAPQGQAQQQSQARQHAQVRIQLKQPAQPSQGRHAARQSLDRQPVQQGQVRQPRQQSLKRRKQPAQQSPVRQAAQHGVSRLARPSQIRQQGLTKQPAARLGVGFSSTNGAQPRTSSTSPVKQIAPPGAAAAARLYSQPLPVATRNEPGAADDTLGPLPVVTFSELQPPASPGSAPRVVTTGAPPRRQPTRQQPSRQQPPRQKQQQQQQQQQQAPTTGFSIMRRLAHGFRGAPRTDAPGRPAPSSTGKAQPVIEAKAAKGSRSAPLEQPGSRVAAARERHARATRQL